MRVMDIPTRQVFVSRDLAHGSVQLQLGDDAAKDARVVSLTAGEARRLAALILFQAARLDRPGAERASRLTGT